MASARFARAVSSALVVSARRVPAAARSVPSAIVRRGASRAAMAEVLGLGAVPLAAMARFGEPAGGGSRNGVNPLVQMAGVVPSARPCTGPADDDGDLLLLDEDGEFSRMCERARREIGVAQF